MKSATVGVLFAVSGEYEDYRERLCEVYAHVDVAGAEATRRNALIATAREKIRVTWGEPDDQWEATERRQKRIRNKLRRDTTDVGIESHDIGDLHYSVVEAKLVP